MTTEKNHRRTNTEEGNEVYYFVNAADVLYHYLAKSRQKRLEIGSIGGNSRSWFSSRSFD